MSEQPEQIEHFLNAESYREKLKQENCNSHKTLLEERIRFLKALSQDLDALEKILSNIQGDEQASSMESDVANKDKLKVAIERASACGSSLVDKIEHSTELLKDIMMECENVSGDIEEISSQIFDIQNGEEISYGSENGGTTNDGGESVLRAARDAEGLSRSRKEEPKEVQSVRDKGSG